MIFYASASLQRPVLRKNKGGCCPFNLDCGYNLVSEPLTHLIGIGYRSYTKFNFRQLPEEQRMRAGEFRHRYSQMMETLQNQNPSSWDDISDLLSRFAASSPEIQKHNQRDFLRLVRNGLAFWTFDFGIDGVSIEIAKYAQGLQKVLGKKQPAEIHFIAGDFHPQADNVLKSDWKRKRIERANGWDKWDGGLWFEKLFYQAMPENSQISQELAVEIWNQAVEMAGKLGNYIAEHEIALLIPVNVNSNPGNLVTGLSTVLVSELMGLYVLNSNHDFYWEGGKPAEEREPGEKAGPRDKFFRNHKNEAFFSFFKRIYPWNGRRWIQININQLQSERLLAEGFSKDRVHEISTMVSDEFFRTYSKDEIKIVRSRMGLILSGGNSEIHPIPIGSHLKELGEWMKNQKPLVCSASEGLSLDLVSDQIHYFLQPTRIIDRKRIEKDWELIDALLQHPPFREDFLANQERQIVLHITGPAPIEHQADLESVLRAYQAVVAKEAAPVANRLFMAFSIGTEYHPSFEEYNFNKLTIEDIYRLATAVVFPSQTEGRGLPIIESSAAGIPIICSRYQPQEIFAGVVGENLPGELQIRYLPFPEDDYTGPVIDEISRYLLDPTQREDDIQHNIEATRQRYSKQVMYSAFDDFLEELRISE